MIPSDKIGIVFGSLTPPEQLRAGAALAERLGLGELWFSEDCFFTGGLSGLTQLLAATREIPAGLGLASIATRHPAVLAMEFAGLARTYPGRVRAGIGLGNRGWLEQMGLLPRRPLTALDETTDILRELLSGATVDRKTDTQTLSDIRLSFPPDTPPELWIGAVNERGLRLAGEKADGVLLSVLAGTAYLRWVRALLPRHAKVTAFVLTAIDEDERIARDAVRDAVAMFLQAESASALVGKSPYAKEIRTAVAELAPSEQLTVPDAWIDEFAVAGTPDQVRARLGGLLDAGANSLGLWLFPPDRLETQLVRLASEVLDTGQSAVSTRPEVGTPVPAVTTMRSNPST
ncbi:LLM class flavin-dependent oxidoreductase [Nocardia sp. CDC160]|uniref:LLM class flavin-dependent oxidoreductase n=1 Tax=Nocardia sp. CDC160 TaxID=3112166 RepID=UPI002DBC88B9|nr:LLM class flavin-dependent oxidoreductase [Nocardia sp. CDC160]MEC3913709.1 LLM class flavin-dependent oxidoreductase [Nocardia sp. CDC160]